MVDSFFRESKIAGPGLDLVTRTGPRDGPFRILSEVGQRWGIPGGGIFGMICLVGDPGEPHLRREFHVIHTTILKNMII
jgi:hypothetical protein